MMLTLVKKRACFTTLVVVLFAMLEGEKCYSSVSHERIEKRILLHPDDSSRLIKTLQQFMQFADSGLYAELIPFYDSNFISIRVVDAGQLIKMDYRQMIAFWNAQLGKHDVSGGFNHHAIVNLTTKIHYVEINGNYGHIILTRIKDLGNGPEPMFYDLTWIKKNGEWRLNREIVHQRSLPNKQ